MKQESLAKNQVGAVAIYVSLFVLVILALMALSFARIIRIGYSETVESQLNLQAGNAAETGINDAKARLVRLLDSYNRGLRSENPRLLEEQPDSPNEPSLLAGDRFGRTLDIDGDRAAVAVYSSPTNGRVIFYDHQGGAWLKRTEADSTIRPALGNIASASHGSDIEIKGNCAFVGLPAPGGGRVVAFKYNPGTPPSWAAATTSANDITGGASFGASISANGHFIAIGEPSADQVKVYRYDSATCVIFASTPSPQTLAPTPADTFGTSVSLNDRGLLAVGAPGPASGDGAFYIYRYDTTAASWILQAVESGGSAEELGSEIALNNNNYLAATARGVSGGEVRIYEYDSVRSLWVKIFDRRGGSGDRFGHGIAMNDRYLAVGAPQATSSPGQIRVFEYKGGWGDASTSPLAYNELRRQVPAGSPPGFVGPLVEGGANGDEYGFAVAFGRTDTLLVGAPGGSPGGYTKVVKVIPDPNFSRDDLGGLIEEKCLSDEGDGDDLYKYNLDDDGHVKYSCLSINLRPDLLYFDKVHEDRSLNVLLRPIEKDSPDYAYRNMRQLDIEWFSADNPPLNGGNWPASAAPGFPSHSAWQTGNYNASVLRVQATVLDIGCTSQPAACEKIDRNMIENNTKVFYLYPSSRTAAGEARKWEGPAGQRLADGEVVEVACASESCVFSLQSLPSHVGIDNGSAEEVAVFLRITSVYGASSLSLKGYGIDVQRSLNGANSPSSLPTSSIPGCPSSPLPASWPPLEECARVNFRDVQAVIGATGHAGHVRVRMEERLRLQPVYDQPEYAVHSASTLCKILIGDPDLGTTTGTPDFGLLVDSSTPYPTGLTQSHIDDYCRVF